MAFFLVFFVLILGVLLLLIFRFDILSVHDQPAEPLLTAGREGLEDDFEGRNNIYDRNFEELAVSFRRSSLYARPLELEDPATSAEQIATVLEADEKKLLSSLKSERSFVWLGRDISWAKAEEIANINMRGVYRLDHVHRFYPGGQRASHVIGFIQDDQGLAGIESYYDNLLRGDNVYNGALAEAGISENIAAGKAGAHLVLTLDVRLQSLLEKELQELVDLTGARTASAVMMIPDSGAILGLANVPDYDPNRFWDYGTEERRNRAIVDTIQLGGLERLFHTAAALDQQLLVPPNGAGEESAIGATAAGDILAPWIWLREGEYVSPEVMKINDYALEPARYRDFAYKIGLLGNEVDLPDELSLTGVGVREELVEEQAGQEEFLQPAPMGEAGTELSRNAAALLTAFCRIVNGGKPMNPHLLNAVWDEKKVWYLPVRLKEGRGTIRPGASQAIMRDFSETAGNYRGDVLILESLMERGLDPAGQTKSAEVSKNPLKPGKMFNQILLGMVGSHGPEAAMVITLENAVLDPGEESQARKIARTLLEKGRQYAGMKQEVPSPQEILAREDGFYLKWQKVEAKSKSQVPLPQDQQQLLMPKVTGQSLRKALQVLQPYGLRIQIIGSGRVVSQRPAAGTSLQGVDYGVLELQDR